MLNIDEFIQTIESKRQKLQVSFEEDCDPASNTLDMLSLVLDSQMGLATAIKELSEKIFRNEADL